MDISYRKVVDAMVKITHCQITLPASEVEDAENTGGKVFPTAYADKVEHTYTFDVNADTGQIEGWAGEAIDLHCKPRDAGVYRLKNGTQTQAVIVHDYVPECLSMNDGGDDYLVLKVNAGGYIEGWRECFIRDKVAECFFPESCDCDCE